MHLNWWENANTRIYISKETLDLWRKVWREKLSVVKYLLSLHRCLPRVSLSAVDKHTEYHFLYCERLVIDYNLVIKHVLELKQS